VKRLRDFEPPVRDAIVALNRRDLSAEQRSAFLREGIRGHELLLGIASDEAVADLPRCNAVGLLFQMQFRGPDLEELRHRDRRPLLMAMVGLLMSPREAVRGTAAASLGHLLSLHALANPYHGWIDRPLIVEALRGTLVRDDVHKATREYLVRILER
jgi:hypothetical protein